MSVFISYAARDLDFVRRLSQDLQKAGVSVWFDAAEVEPGVEWTSAVTKAMNAASALIFVGSRASVNSVTVRREVLSFHERGAPIIPIRLEAIAFTPTLMEAVGRGRFIDFEYAYPAGLKTLIAALPKSLPGCQLPEVQSQGSKGYVFLSYAEEDTGFVDDLTRYLGERGYAYWDYTRTDRNYQVLLHMELEEAIQKAVATICVLSPAWRTSTWAVKEYLYAEEIHTPTFLLKVQEMPPTLVLAGSHFIDFVLDPARGFERLDHELRRKGL